MMFRRLGTVLALTFVTTLPASPGTITFTPLNGTVVFDGGKPIRFVVGLLDDFETVGSELSGAELDIGVNGGPRAVFKPGDIPVFVSDPTPPSTFDSGEVVLFLSFNGIPLPSTGFGTVTISGNHHHGSFVLVGIGNAFSNMQSEAAFGFIKFDVIPLPAPTNLQDFSRFQECFGGEGVELSASCRPLDYDLDDDDVDFDDYHVFHRVFTGPR